MEKRKWIVWEVPENITKSKASLLAGCKCKTGCTTCICSCKKKDRSCGLSCLCHFCQNNQNAGEVTSRDKTDLVVQDLLEEQSEDTYTDESDNDLDEFPREEMEDDMELRAFMEFVFGPESDEED